MSGLCVWLLPKMCRSSLFQYWTIFHHSYSQNEPGFLVLDQNLINATWWTAMVGSTFLKWMEGAPVGLMNRVIKILVCISDWAFYSELDCKLMKLWPSNRFPIYLSSKVHARMRAVLPFYDGRSGQAWECHLGTGAGWQSQESSASRDKSRREMYNWHRSTTI